MGSSETEHHESVGPDGHHRCGRLTFTKVSAHNNHTCAVTSTGRLYCWGNNDEGQLGDGTTTSRLVPTLVRASPPWQP